MPELELIIAVVVPAFATLFVAIDPIGLVPMFLALTPNADAAERRRIARRCILTAAAVLLLFAFFGEAVLGFLGIGMPAFQIAGGLMLFLIAVEMLFEKRTERRSRNVAEAGGDEHASDDVSVFPLGVPLIAGPGGIASIILLMGQHNGNYVNQGIVIGVLLALLLLTGLSFYAADQLGRLTGPTFTKAVTRVLGIILGALAVQFVLTGLASSGLVAAT
jgi:multiple antibiotic resistance protein